MTPPLEPKDELFDFGFPFGKSTITRILKDYANHIERPYSEVFEFYTASAVEQALQSYVEKQVKGLADKIQEIDNPYGSEDGTAESLKMAYHAFEVGRGMALGVVLLTPKLETEEENE